MVSGMLLAMWGLLVVGWMRAERERAGAAMVVRIADPGVEQPGRPFV
jgi:hypothetical protein